MTSRETGHEPEAREVPPPRRWQLTVGAFTLGALVVLVDQGTKTWAEATLIEGERVPLIGNLLGLQLAYNPGAAFSFGENSTPVFALAAVVATVTAVVFALRVRRPRWAIVIGALGGAAASHTGDRLFREPGFAQGHVVDFLAYGTWFIGNVADIVIVAAAITGVLLMLRERPGE